MASQRPTKTLQLLARCVVEEFADRVLLGHRDWPHPNLKDHARTTA